MEQELAQLRAAMAAYNERMEQMGNTQTQLQEELNAVRQENQELKDFQEAAQSDEEKAQALAAAIVQNLPQPTPKNHAKDLDKSQRLCLDEAPGAPKVYVEDWHKNIESDFELHNTPDHLKVQLAVGRLDGKALLSFNAFTNAAGNVGCRRTTTWLEFSTFMLSLAVDKIVERDNLEKEFLKIEQKGSAEQFSNSYRLLVAKIKNNSEERKLHTEAGYILSYIQKLKPEVQSRMIDKDFTSLEEAITESIRKDNLVFAQQQKIRQFQNDRRQGGVPSGGAGRSPSAAGGASSHHSRAGTPAPPPAFVQALLAAVGYNLDGTPQTGSVPPAGPSPGSPAAGINGVERNHSVAPGAPIPKMTPEIKAWCLKNGACFRCRVPNAKHLAAKCPRFEQLSNLEEEPAYTDFSTPSPPPTSGND
eukprot:CAMPEP_0181317180 /NCGR_PEP_ID=MMETSP1101-20121128/16315_1 /TAXON_ID=46948 /ORGANISM="Rhodomonas abbreviata, Strain Caron Lab Isolate" /LENGTH=417 /DNA_ID=CAMNT_0023424525 /DNA_START=1353 /DNA_END=2606 /DNA_ORIENTATION=+